MTAVRIHEGTWITTATIESIEIDTLYITVYTISGRIYHLPYSDELKETLLLAIHTPLQISERSYHE